MEKQYQRVSETALIDRKASAELTYKLDQRERELLNLREQEQIDRALINDQATTLAQREEQIVELERLATGYCQEKESSDRDLQIVREQKIEIEVD